MVWSGTPCLRCNKSRCIDIVKQVVCPRVPVFPFRKFDSDELYGDQSYGGALYANWVAIVEFQEGLTATGNIAEKGGALYLDK